jgi:hypothetical protein
LASLLSKSAGTVVQIGGLPPDTFSSYPTGLRVPAQDMKVRDNSKINTFFILTPLFYEVIFYFPARAGATAPAPRSELRKQNTEFQNTESRTAD